VRGRRKGSGSHDVRDMELLKEMQALVLSGMATSPWAATATVYSKAAGASENAIRKRLLRKYHARLLDLI
jgi:hypothetical protein